MTNYSKMTKAQILEVLENKFTEIDELNATITTLRAEVKALNDVIATTKARTKTVNEIVYIKACMAEDYVAVSVNVPKYLKFADSASYGIKQELKRFGAKFNGHKTGNTWIANDSKKPMTWIMGVTEYEDWKSSQSPESLKHLQMVTEIDELSNWERKQA